MAKVKREATKLSELKKKELFIMVAWYKLTKKVLSNDRNSTPQRRNN